MPPQSWFYYLSFPSFFKLLLLSPALGLSVRGWLHLLQPFNAIETFYGWGHHAVSAFQMCPRAHQGWRPLIYTVLQEASAQDCVLNFLESCPGILTCTRLACTWRFFSLSLSILLPNSSVSFLLEPPYNIWQQSPFFQRKLGRQQGMREGKHFLIGWDFLKSMPFHPAC